jgi:hypothetical protein
MTLLLSETRGNVTLQVQDISSEAQRHTVVISTDCSLIVCKFFLTVELILAIALFRVHRRVSIWMLVAHH